MRPPSPPPDAAAGTKPPPPLPPSPPGPDRGASLRGPPRSDPNPIVFATRRFTMTNPGPRPKLRDSSGSPGDGFGSSRPYRVGISPGLFASVATPVLPLNNVLP